MSKPITEKVKRVVDLVMSDYPIEYVELQFYNREYLKVYDVLVEQGILDMENLYVKLFFHDGGCRLYIGAKELKE